MGTGTSTAPNTDTHLSTPTELYAPLNLPAPEAAEFVELIPLHPYTCGPGSVGGIATAYGLESPGIESRLDEIFRTRPDRP